MGLSTDRFIVLSDNVIALAGGLPQARSLRQGYPTAFEVENSSLFEYRDQHAHGGSVRAHQLREEFFRHGEACCVHPVERHQDPTRATLLQSVRLVASRCAHGGNEQGVRVLREDVPEMPAYLQFSAEIG